MGKLRVCICKYKQMKENIEMKMLEFTP